MNVVEEKTLLAKLMATENIHVVHKSSARTARFDLKTRTLTCPVWKDMDGDVYDLLMGHEISHALHTPLQGWHNALDQGPQKKAFRSFLNVIEDARIERFVKEKFPGIRKPMMNGYKTLFERDFFGTSKIENLNKDLYLIDKINIAAKLGSLVSIKFNQVEQRFFDRVMTVHTWDEVAALALELFEYSKKEQKEINDRKKEEYRKKQEQLQEESDEEEREKEEEKREEFGEEFEEGDGEEFEEGDGEEEDQDGGLGSGDGDGEDEQDNGSDSSDEDGDGDGDENSPNGDGKGEKDSSGEGDNESNSPGNGVSKTGSSDGSDLPKSITDESYRKKEQELVENDVNVSYIDVYVPKVNLKDILVSCHTVNKGIDHIYQHYYKAGEIALELYRKFKEKNNDYINLLVKEFEMRKAAKAFKRRKLSDTGEIDTKKLPFYKLTDDIFRKMMTVQAGKSHGLTLVLDKSGSMNDHIIAAMEQLLILAIFCRKVNIPFIGFTFTNVSGWGIHQDFQNPSDLHPFSKRDGDLRLNDLNLREIINSTMNQATFTKSVINQLLISHMLAHHPLVNTFSIPDQEKMGGTPLNEALIVLRDVVKLFKKKHRVDIVNTIIVHDGDACNLSSYYRERQYYTNFDKSNRLTLHDKKEKISIRFTTNEPRYMTKTLMKWFQLTTGSGIYGFFIVNKRQSEFRDALNNYYHNEHGVKVMFEVNNPESALQFSNIREKFINEKFLESHTPGYNGFFFIPGSSDLAAQTGVIEDTGKAWTPGRLLTAFIKAGKKQQFSRVLVSKFIGMIATEKTT